MVPTLGGVHKIQISIRDLLKDFFQKIFGEEMGGGQGETPLLFVDFCGYSGLPSSKKGLIGTH